MSDKKSNDHCEDMGFRMAYRQLVASRRLTTVFRPYHEKYARLYPVGHCVNGRVIIAPGDAKRNIAPLYDRTDAKVRIVGTQTKRMGDLTQQDFVGSSPDIYDADSLKWHLALIYNKSAAHFDRDTKIVVIKLRYE